MAIANALNRDPFLTGGVMDAPDPVVRSAMAKMLNPQGLPPMTQKELNRLLGRQYLEQENIRQSNTASQQTAAVRQQGPVDVASYAGSMWAKPGSYSQMRPIPETQFARPIQAPSAPVGDIPVLSALLGLNQPVKQAVPSAARTGFVNPAAVSEIMSRDMSAYSPANAIMGQTPEAMRAETQRQAMQLNKDQFTMSQLDFLSRRQNEQKELELKKSKMAQLSATPEEAVARAQSSITDPQNQMASFVAHEGGFLPSIMAKPGATFEPAAERTAAEARAKRVSEGLDKFKKDYETAISAEQSARMVTRALDQGVTTGMFTGAKNFAKRVAEAAGFDLGVTDSILAAKGIAGLQAGALRGVMQGLGSMSNADREFAVAAMPSITDDTKANRFFAELALENARLAKEDAAFRRKLEKDQKMTDLDILHALEERRDSRNVAEDVYNRVMSGVSAAPTKAAEPSKALEGLKPLSPKAQSFFGAR